MSLLNASASEQAAIAFLNSLNEQQEKMLLQAFDENRTNWHFLPAAMFDRKGVFIRDLDDRQRSLLHELLQSYLSRKGYSKTVNIIELENVLRDLGGGRYRDPELYMVAFYGMPGRDKVWGWKFEGHHISLNFTVVGDKISYVPLFFGANPAEVPSGKQKGLRALKEEEDIALQLMASMNNQQKAKAIFRQNAYSDIISGNDPYIEQLDKEGIQAGELNNEQKTLLSALIMEYLSAMPRELAQKRLKQVQESKFDEIWFGWAGGVALHAPHYYRIQGEKFLIELDNTQNSANHIHCVWRDFDGDFGRNLIREHYKNSDHHDHQR